MMAAMLDGRIERVRRSRRCTCRSRSDSARVLLADDPPPVPVVAIVGSVAVGKSTTARALRELLGARCPAQPHVELVATDGFLFPNPVLDARGLTMRKGFPESYDLAALARVPRRGASRRATGSTSRCTRTSSTTSFPAPSRSWPDRVCAHRRPRAHRARDRASRRLRHLPRRRRARHRELVRRPLRSSMFSEDLLDDRVRQAWDAINVVNLHEHILPTRERADVVLEKGPDHVVSRVVLRVDCTCDDDTMTSAMNADQELVDMLEEVWSSIDDARRELDEAEWKRETECPGWTVQDNLVHLAALEWLHPRRPAADHDAARRPAPREEHVGKINERVRRLAALVVGCRRARRVPRGHPRRVSPSSARSTTTASAPTRGRRWARAPCATCSPFRIFDSWVHEQDMRRAVGRPGDLDSPAAAHRHREWSGVDAVRRREEGRGLPTVPRSCSRSRARSRATSSSAWSTAAAALLDAAPDDPTVALAHGTETFARLACGRIDPAAAVAAGEVTIDGDAELGRRVVDQMNYMF